MNIMGLTVGICASLLLFLYIQDERSVNKFHENHERIYQVMENQVYAGNNIVTTTANPGPLMEPLKQEMPEIEHMVQLSWEEEKLFVLGDRTFKEKGRAVSSDFFELFTFPFVEGSDEGSLVAPDVGYISESLAKKMFGQEPALDKTFTVTGWGDFKVGGVFRDVPANSSLQFEFILPNQRWWEDNQWMEDWGNNGMRHFLSLHEGVDGEEFSNKIKDFIRKRNGGVVEMFAHPLDDVYLRNGFKDGKQSGGRIVYVRLFSVVASFILIIACINFMNLATARSSKRAKEVGVKKVVGSTKAHLITQFMAESILLSMISALLAGFLVMVLLPELNLFTGKEMYFSLLEPMHLGLLIGIAMVVGLMAGSYPSIFLSSFAPVKVLKGSFKSSGWSNGVRKGLVVFQFLISTFLIMGTLIVHKQIGYVKNKNLGYNKDNIIHIPLEGDLRDKADLFKSRMLDNPNIKSVTTSSVLPIFMGSSTSGGFRWDGKDPESTILFQVLSVGHDFFETLNMEMTDGRPFDKRLTSDSANVIINELTAKSMGLENVLDYPVFFWGREGKVAGIVKDFHFSSLHSKIEPLVIALRPERTNYFLMKVNGQEIERTLDYIEENFETFNPSYPFEYGFLDSSYAALYERETNIGTLANFFAGIAIFISLLGLFGLASFAAEQRIKEIGIRKVLGAGVAHLVALLAKNFLVLVFIGFGISVPLSYFAMSDWLMAFEYKITIGAGAFLIAGLSAIIIALITVSYHSLKAAYANPVKSLRYE